MCLFVLMQFPVPLPSAALQTAQLRARKSWWEEMFSELLRGQHSNKAFAFEDSSARPMDFAGNLFYMCMECYRSFLDKIWMFSFEESAYASLLMVWWGTWKKLCWLHLFFPVIGGKTIWKHSLFWFMLAKYCFSFKTARSNQIACKRDLRASKLCMRHVNERRCPSREYHSHVLHGE